MQATRKGIRATRVVSYWPAWMTLRVICFFPYGISPALLFPCQDPLLRWRRTSRFACSCVRLAWLRGQPLLHAKTNRISASFPRRHAASSPPTTLRRRQSIQLNMCGSQSVDIDDANVQFTAARVDCEVQSIRQALHLSKRFRQSFPDNPITLDERNRLREMRGSTPDSGSRMVDWPPGKAYWVLALCRF
jgi:hypothetical protein